MIIKRIATILTLICLVTVFSLTLGSGYNYAHAEALVSNSPLQISTTVLPQATICGLFASNCSSYSSVLSASGGTPFYQWTLNSGSLPMGISLQSQGILVGTAYFFDSPGIYQFSVKVTDSAGNSSVANLSINLRNANSPIILTSSLPQATICGLFSSNCSSYLATLTASGGTGSGYSWSLLSGVLPYGLTLQSNGVISGPMVFFDNTPGVYPLEFKVTDSAGNSNVAWINLNVIAQP